MASLRTILACAVPAVTALFGIFWLFNRKKSPPPPSITEPLDKQNPEAEISQINDGSRENDSNKANGETDGERDEPSIISPTRDNMCYGDTMENVQKQNENDEMINEIELAFKDILKDSEQDGVENDNEASESSEKLSLGEMNVAYEHGKDEMYRNTDVTNLSNVSNVVQEDFITRQKAENLNHNAVSLSESLVNSEVIGQTENTCHEELVVAASADSKNSELESETLSHESQHVNVTALEALVIPSDEQPLKSESNDVLDWSKSVEDSLESEQRDAIIESQIISEQAGSTSSIPTDAYSSTSQKPQASEMLQKTENSSLQNEKLDLGQSPKHDYKTEEHISDKTVQPGSYPKVNKVIETTETKDQVGGTSKRHNKTQHSEVESDSWAVNGEQLDSESLPQNAKGNVISSKSANTMACSNNDSVNKVGVGERRDRSRGSVNSSESSSNCDSSSVASSGSSRGGSTPEILNHRHDDQEHIFEFNMPSDLCGLFIGSRGKTIKSIRDQSGARIKLRNNPYTPDFQICVIEGPQSAIDKACNIIKRKFPSVKYPGIDMTPLPVNNSPVLMPEIMQLSLPEGVSVDIVVSSIVDAGRLFVQQPTHPSFPSLERLNSYMLTCYMQEGAVPDIPRPIENGVICAAPMLNGWYRAQIMAVYEASDECDIKYVDYGGYSRISSQCLKQIRSDFMTLPFEAVECYMANITPLQGETYFSTEAAAVLEELTQGKLLQAQVVGKAEDGIPYVHIYQISGNNTSALMVNREIVNRGVARWIEVLS